MTKKIMIGLGIMGGVAILAGLVSTCNSEYTYHPHGNEMDSTRHNPTPAELAREAAREDSLWRVAKVRLHTEMENVVKGYRPNFKDNRYSGYFTTDLNSDDVPELWVLIGSPGESFRLELYYPTIDGTLKRSYEYTGFGTYYLGNSYLMQATKSGSDLIYINKITIRNGDLYSDTIRTIDLADDTNAKLPPFKEREIRLTSFSNMSTLDNSFK